MAGIKVNKQKNKGENNMENNKLIINARLLRKEPNFEISTCIVEKAVAAEHGEFEKLKSDPLSDNDIIRENKEIMYCDRNGVYHCLLIYDKEQGDGIIVESEGADYARYAQYVPNAKLMYEEHINNRIQEMKFYCPLTIRSGYDPDEAYEIEAEEAAEYEQEILKCIHGDKEIFETKRGLMQYSRDNDIEKKVLSVFPKVEVKNGKLMGVYDCKVRPDITNEDIEDLREYLMTESKNGWGEKFEQQEIQTTEHGDIYVSFWDIIDYFMMTEEEMENCQSEEMREEPEINMTM